MSERYIGRQPIIDTRAKIAAYDLLYRESGHTDNNAITASVISNLLSTFGIETTLGKHIGFVRVNAEFLDYEVIHALPKEKIVYSLLSDTLINEKLVDRIEELHAQGYRFALNDLVFTDESIAHYAMLLTWISYIKIDAVASNMSSVDKMMGKFKEVGIKVVGVKIETHETYDLCRSMGFDCFQGYFISEPNIIKNSTFSPEQASVLQLWNLLRNDTDMPILVKAFEQSHAVSLKLLRFINSAAFGLRNPVSSIEHVLSLMGRDPISQWIMLMMFSEGSGDNSNARVPLLLMVVNRTEMMMALMSLFDSKASKEERSTAYFVGMLSLIHLLFHMPQYEILDKLNISLEIEQALLKGEGRYGEMLELVRAIELFDVETMEALLETKGFTFSQIEPLIAQVMEKVNTFEKAIQE